MESYYAQQSEMPHYASQYRQRGSGFGALAAGIGRFVIPFTKRYVLPVAKRIGRELLTQGLPEIAQVITKRKSPRQAARDTVKRTVRKQVGGAKKGRRRRKAKPAKRRRTRKATRRRRVIPKSAIGQRSRSTFFSKVNNAY